MKAEENKFKGIRVDNGEWVYGDFFKSWDNCYILRGTVNGVPVMVEVTPETVSQFTGLKDKNGADIYSDDKFQYHEHEGFILPDFTGEILFMDGCFGYVATSENMGEAFHSFSEFDELQEDFLDHIEVIGNIHDKHKHKQQ